MAPVTTMRYAGSVQVATKWCRVKWPRDESSGWSSLVSMLLNWGLLWSENVGKIWPMVRYKCLQLKTITIPSTPMVVSPKTIAIPLTSMIAFQPLKVSNTIDCLAKCLPFVGNLRTSFKSNACLSKIIDQSIALIFLPSLKLIVGWWWWVTYRSG